MFNITTTPQICNNTSLVYRESEQSIDTIPRSESVYTSICLNYLNIDVDADGRVIGAWGLLPKASWKHTRLNPPNAQIGEVVYEHVHENKAGVAIDLDGPWNVEFDETTGWIKIGNNGGGKVAIMPTNTIIMEFSNDRKLQSVWLRPIIA